MCHSYSYLLPKENTPQLLTIPPSKERAPSLMQGSACIISALV